MIIFLIVGIAALTVGLLSIFSSRFDQYLHSLFPDSKLDKRVLSAENRYFIRRYLSGIQGVCAGIAGIALYVFTNEQIADSLANWLDATFGL
jgi:hypothetical protein